MQSFSGPREVLYLDNNPQFRKTFDFSLKVCGFRVHRFRDGDECLNWISIGRLTSTGQLANVACLIVNGWPAGPGRPQFFDELARLKVKFPILCLVEHEEQNPHGQDGIFPGIQVSVCKPARALSCLEKIKAVSRART